MLIQLFIRNCTKVRRRHLCIALAIVLLFIQAFLSLHIAVAGEYERKSISLMASLAPGAERMPEERLSQLMKAIEKQIKIPRLDYNALPQSLQILSLGTSREGLSREEMTIERVPAALIKILSDPELQKARAKDYVNEEERNKFITTKAHEFGITSEDLKKVMNSACLCIVTLTDYSNTRSKVTVIDKENVYYKVVENGKTVTKVKVVEKKKPVIRVSYTLSGYVSWFRFILTEKKPDMRLLKSIGIQASGSSDFDATPKKPSKLEKKLTQTMKALGYKVPSSQAPTTGPFTLDWTDNSAFESAVNEFVGNLDMETREIEYFRLKVGIYEVNKGMVSFPLGKREGLYIGQKFSVYEEQEIGNAVKQRKRGFFYVNKLGDNDSNSDELSYGKLVISGAEPGMTVQELPASGWYVGLSSKYGMAKMKESDVPINTLNINASYDLGRFTRIPQLFFTIGAGLGNLMFSTIDESNIDTSETAMSSFGIGNVYYMDLYAGCLKKYYVNRMALYIEPLVQFQGIKINGVGSNSGVSFSPNIGIEFAIQEYLSAGIGLNIRLLSDDWGEPGVDFELDSGSMIHTRHESDLAFPKMFIGVHVTYNMH